MASGPKFPLPDHFSRFIDADGSVTPTPRSPFEDHPDDASIAPDDEIGPTPRPKLDDTTDE